MRGGAQKGLYVRISITIVPVDKGDETERLELNWINSTSSCFLFSWSLFWGGWRMLEEVRFNSNPENC